MKIKRYQQGGGVTYLPYVGRVAGATSPSTSSSPKNGGLDDTTSGLLAKNGLPSDHAYFMSQMASLYTNDPLTSDSTSTSTKLLMLHSLANNMMYNKGLSDSAWKEVESTEAGGDVAMSSSGRLYAIDSKGSIKTISPESYYQNRDKYQLLTNTELLNYRDTNTSAAFNTSILPDLQNITSMKSIVEYLQNTITKFGTTEMKNKNSALTVQEKNQISNGMQTLINGNAEGVFKITQTTHSKTEVQDVNVALKYLWDTLTTDQKKTIIAHTAAEGKDPSKMENVYSILALALTHHTDTAYDTAMDVEYDSSASKGMVIGGGVNTGDGKYVPESWGHAVQNDLGAAVTSGKVLNAANIKFNFQAYHWGNIQNSYTQKPLEAVVSTMTETMSNLQGHGIRDTRRSSYFGNIKVTGKDAENILVNNQYGGEVIYLPVDANGNIAWSILDEMTKIQEEIVNKNLKNQNDQRAYWESKGFTYDEKAGAGIPKGYTMGKYWSQIAATSTAVDGIDSGSLENSKYINNINDDTMEWYERNYNNRADIKKKNKEIDITPSNWWFNDSYRSMIFIPINDNEIESLVASGSGYMNRPYVYEIDAQQQAAELGGGYNSNAGLYIPVQGQNLSALNN